MKRMINYISFILVGALMFTGCESGMNEVDVENTPSVNGSKLVPLTNESGTVRAYIGTEISTEGFNLERVKRVSIGDKDAEITEQSMKVLKFKVPALELSQQDAPHQVDLKIYGEDAQSVIFTRPYYVTIPVTDAIVTGYAPAEGTVGTEITVSGRNLEQITRVKFGAVTVEAADFTALTAAAVKFTLPAGTYAAGDSDQAISAEWGTATIDVTGDKPFKIHTPKFDALAAQPAGQNSILGDEIQLTGINLDLVSSVKWGAYEMSITEQSATVMIVKFPASIEKADPVVQTKALNAYYGTPAQTVALAATWRLDTTPTGLPKPAATSMTAEDGGADNKFYLGKTVTVAGENLTFVEGIEVRYNDDKVAATIAAGATNTELQFTVPDGVSFSTMTEVKIVAIYNTTDEVEFGAVNLYPFYYYKDLAIGSGSSSTTNYPYPAFARENAFFLPDTNEVISADEWVSQTTDSFALQSPNPAIASGSTLAKAKITQAQYYGITPYLFITTGSDGKLAWQNPANSASQLKTHRSADNKAISGTYGTPIVFFKVLKSGDDFDAIKNGSVESVSAYDAVAGSSAPAFGTSRDWTVGDVIVVQHVSYTKGAKPAAIGDIYKQGFIVVKEVTCADAAAGSATDLTGHVKFDFYWSKEMNK